MLSCLLHLRCRLLCRTWYCRGVLRISGYCLTPEILLPGLVSEIPCSVFMCSQLFTFVPYILHPTVFVSDFPRYSCPLCVSLSVRFFRIVC